jgi:hypothetical protein
VCNEHDFEFNVDAAFLDQLRAAFEGGPVHPLASHDAPAKLGVYGLYVQGGLVPVYVGSATSKEGIRSRLGDHRSKIRTRQNIELDHVTCRYLVIGRVWEVVHAEAVLIDYYDPPWNKLRGFGRHAPGGGRPGLPGNVNQWDTLYPPRV